MPAALARYWAGHRRPRKHRRRRSNPTRALVHRRRRRRMTIIPFRARRSAPKIRRRRRRHFLSGRPRRLVSRRRRNPFRVRSIGHFVRVIFFGAIGVTSARLGKFLYAKFLGKHVRGDGSSKIRTFADETLSLASMVVLTLGVERGLKMLPGVRYEDCTAVKIGGYGETGRELVGVIVKAVKGSRPEFLAGRDGRMTPAQMAAYQQQLQLAQQSQAFQGGLEFDASAFNGLEYADESFDGHGHPLANGGGNF